MQKYQLSFLLLISICTHGFGMDDNTDEPSWSEITAQLTLDEKYYLSLFLLDKDSPTMKFLQAVTQGKLDEAKAMLEEDEELVNKKLLSTGHTALHAACMGGQHTAIPFLVRYGADVNSLDLYGSTPLATAAEYNQMKAVRALIGQGALIDIPLSKNPISEAQARGYNDIVRYLQTIRLQRTRSSQAGGAAGTARNSCREAEETKD